MTSVFVEAVPPAASVVVLLLPVPVIAIVDVYKTRENTNTRSIFAKSGLPVLYLPPNPALVRQNYIQIQKRQEEN